MEGVIWTCKPFKDLDPYELYAILKLRIEVFVVEQKCNFQDADDKDQECYHLTANVNNHLAAYARLVPSGVTYSYISIGRILTSPAYRKAGLGKALIREAIERSYSLFGRQKIKIGAQLYLLQFYESFGFKQISEMYLEDHIPHVEMLLDP